MKISQREARRLLKRVKALEHAFSLQRRSWAQEYLGGMQIGTAKWDALDSRPVAIRTAQKLGHAVVVDADSEGLVRFVALPHHKEGA